MASAKSSERWPAHTGLELFSRTEKHSVLRCRSSCPPEPKALLQETLHFPVFPALRQPPVYMTASHPPGTFHEMNAEITEAVPVGNVTHIVGEKNCNRLG